jgi:adenosylcobinamide kinase/adenosylcobinamide-phosphate guanylyltransferase
MGRVVLVLGGARSGKSEVAERLAGDDVTYVATGLPVDGGGMDGDAGDPDWAARVAAHRARRPASWRTVEAGDDLAAAVGSAPGTALVDSLGAWVARAEGFEVDVEHLCRALGERDGDAVVVSDEVGLGVHPSTEAGRRFRDALGEVNRIVADGADEVLLVVAGRTLKLS